MVKSLSFFVRATDSTAVGRERVPEKALLHTFTIPIANRPSYFVSIAPFHLNKTGCLASERKVSSGIELVVVEGTVCGRILRGICTSPRLQTNNAEETGLEKS